jgi:hypothetical protein
MQDMFVRVALAAPSIAFAVSAPAQAADTTHKLSPERIATASRPRHTVRSKLELLPDLQVGRKLRVNSATTLVTPLFETPALKASYVVNFDNDPEPGRRKTDRFLTTGVQLSF